MNKQELIDDLATISGESKAAIARVLEALTQSVTSELEDGGEVTLPGLGKFSIGHRSARTVTSPLVGGTMEIPATRTAKFKAAKPLKDALKA